MGVRIRWEASNSDNGSGWLMKGFCKCVKYADNTTLLFFGGMQDFRANGREDLKVKTLLRLQKSLFFLN